MSWNNPNFWSLLSGIVSVTISSLVSLLIAFRFGPRHVEGERRKREHSVKLMTDGLIPLRDGRKQICAVGFQYSPENNRIEAIRPEDPKNLVLYDAIKAHLVSGHSEILEAWEDYKSAVLQHNRNVAGFVERIRQEIACSADLPEYHHLFRQNEPAEYIIPAKAAEEVYSGLRFESVNGKEWLGKVKVQSYVQGDTGQRWHTLEFSSANIGRARSPQRFDSTSSTIDTIRNSKQNRLTVDQFVKLEREVLLPKEREFEDKVNDIIRSIELGNCLRGKCKDCPS